MSDIADDAQGATDLGVSGARFQTRRTGTEIGRIVECGRCGSRPGYVMAERSREILKCPKCRRQTQALSSGQRLIAEWNGINT